MAYALVEELRQVLDLPPEDTSNDVDLQRALDAAATWVDWFTGRSFGATGTATAPVARTYAAATEDSVVLVDLQSSAPVVEVDTAGDRTFTTTLVPAQYVLEPYSGPPFSTLRAWAVPGGDVEPVVFVPGQLVRVTGVWGYVDAQGEVPATVNEANLLLGARYYKRRESPMGVLQQPELDTYQILPRQDADAIALLSAMALPGSPGAALLGTVAGVYGAAWVAV